MNLRTRILVGYGYLVTLLVVSAGGAALSFHWLGRSIDRVLRDNVTGVRVATAMLESLERQDSATLGLLLGRDEAADLAQAQQAFRTTLAQASTDLTMPDEGEIVAQIRDRFEDYLTTRDGLLGARPADALQAYEREISPRLAATKNVVFELLEANSNAVRDTDREARLVAFRSSIALGVLVSVALLSLGYISRNLQRELLGRLVEMKSAAEAIAAGDLRRRLAPARDDELGVVASQLNAALGALGALDGRMRGLLAQQRQLLLGLLAQRAEPAALVGLDGEIIASTLTEGETELLTERLDEVRARSRAMVRSPDGVAADGFHLELAPGQALAATALVAAPGRAVGWLVRLAPRR
jgi:HAMP domain-containing protein